MEGVGYLAFIGAREHAAARTKCLVLTQVAPRN